MFKIGQRVSANSDNQLKLTWPLAGKNGIKVKNGHLGTIVGFTNYPEQEHQYPMVLWDNTEEAVQLRHKQAIIVEETKTN